MTAGMMNIIEPEGSGTAVTCVLCQTEKGGPPVGKPLTLFQSGTAGGCIASASPAPAAPVSIVMYQETRFASVQVVPS